MTLIQVTIGEQRDKIKKKWIHIFLWREYLNRKMTNQKDYIIDPCIQDSQFDLLLSGHKEPSKPQVGVSGGGFDRPPDQWILFPATYCNVLLAP